MSLYLIDQTPSTPRGGFLFGWFPNKELGGRGPLPPGSLFGHHPKRKPPRGGGVSFDQYVTFDIKTKT